MGHERLCLRVVLSYSLFSRFAAAVIARYTQASPRGAERRRREDKAVCVCVCVSLSLSLSLSLCMWKGELPSFGFCASFSPGLHGFQTSVSVWSIWWEIQHVLNGLGASLASLPPPMSSAIVAMLHGYLLRKSRRWYRRRLSAKYLFLSAVGFCALLDCCARFRDWNNQGLCNACKTFENLLVCVLQSFPRIE